MDPSSQTWPSSSYMECFDGMADILPCQLSPKWNHYPSFCDFDQTTLSEASTTTLTFSNSHQQNFPSFRKPFSSQLSFGNSSNSTISNPSSHWNTRMGSFAVKNEAGEINQMISFHGSECITSPSFVTQEQPVKSTRTPQQARYHVLAERKRRKKLSQQFLSLSALVPGLAKTDKNSVIEGAISHMKHLEERLKVLEEEGKTGKPVSLYYEDNSSPLKNLEIRILKEDVLIKIDCENLTGFTKEKFISEMKKLHLSVTKMMFLPFGDNMLAVSSVAKIKVEFSMTEELANSIRLAILKLINAREEKAHELINKHIYLLSRR